MDPACAATFGDGTSPPTTRTLCPTTDKNVVRAVRMRGVTLHGGWSLNPLSESHAFGHLDFLKEVGDPATGQPIGDTEMNLKSAVEGETYEYTQMYPGMAKTARDEGFPELAEWFETLAKAERSHANRFTKGLDSLKQG